MCGPRVSFSSKQRDSSKRSDRISRCTIMYVVQVHNLKAVLPSTESTKDVHLEIYSEGHPARRFNLGRFGRQYVKQRSFESITHLTSAPVTLKLILGPRRYHSLGSHILLDFLYTSGSEQPTEWIETRHKGQLVFGRGETATYYLKYTISPVYFSYRFALNQVNCLENNSPLGLKDRLSAVVDNFRIKFMVNRVSLKQYDLGSLKFVPLTQVFRKVKKGDADTTAPEQHLLEGVLFLREGFIGAEEGVDVEDNHQLLLDRESFVIKKVIMGSGPDSTYGTNYEFTFTLTKEVHTSRLSLMSVGNMVKSSSEQQQKLLDFINEKDLPWVLANGKMSEQKKRHKLITGGEEVDDIVTNKKLKGEMSYNNDVEVLIDGQQTFQRYFEILSQAKHSVKILAWDLTFSFALCPKQSHTPHTLEFERWHTLEDVIIEKAIQGVSIQMIVWRHKVLNYLERFLYSGIGGSTSIEQEVLKLEKRCLQLGISIKILHLMSDSMPTPDSPYSTPSDASKISTVTIILVGSPSGIYLASHHEKLLLVDAECTRHAKAFVGGFDICRGRYDSPNHVIPKKASAKSDAPEHPHTAPAGLGVGLLWHDLQFLITGHSTQILYLHFLQRWVHAFNRNAPKTRKQVVIPKMMKECESVEEVEEKRETFRGTNIRVLRIWKGVFDTQYLFREYTEMIQQAKKSIYIEHQYPFHNYPLTHFMCQALINNPNLQLIIVAPIKTDLLTGFVGNLVDWSEDHIIEHLNTIKKTAPQRVGIYGILQQDSKSSRVEPVYIHSKICIIDDEWILTGSSNMDNMSFFYSSELSFSMMNPALAKYTRAKLFQEHLGHHYHSDMTDNFSLAFDAFRQVSTQNDKKIRSGDKLIGRPVMMSPSEPYQQVLKRVYPLSTWNQILLTVGRNVEAGIQFVGERGRAVTQQLPGMRSNL
ncbi:hypothetical protein PROFUN_09787 [Planoprotostelium fungivorum]|uniref:phospholipase D n=1 Tax=Planoprotostelium fungivorum TaxID=1890364 RepID=A0A2P6NGM2_9EUKA|nr:hypothetical protein PROFUN_09787 [Planoprotostelium fungivorum]